MNDKIKEIKEYVALCEKTGFKYLDAVDDITYLLQQLEEQTKRAETATKANTLLVMGNSDLISRTHELHAMVDTQSKALREIEELQTDYNSNKDIRVNRIIKEALSII
ncbi:hypothetical protein PMSD_09965 [Paenibacillus macquariensis subsp. defensor]|nr:hypothetical protein PMSD_09965 [Paenibacillus macquariensis subsp. defensor]